MYGTPSVVQTQPCKIKSSFNNLCLVEEIVSLSDVYNNKKKLIERYKLSIFTVE